MNRIDFFCDLLSGYYLGSIPDSVSSICFSKQILYCPDTLEKLSFFSDFL